MVFYLCYGNTGRCILRGPKDLSWHSVGVARAVNAEGVVVVLYLGAVLAVLVLKEWLCSWITLCNKLDFPQLK